MVFWSNRRRSGVNSEVKPLIALDGVSRVYPRGRVTALREVTLEIRSGDYTAIMGPSGSGKSTLLYLACGLDRPTAGRVLFEGRELKAPAEWAELRACRIGFVFQSFYLIGGLTASENVEIPMLGRMRSERDRRKRVAGLLERVGLGHRTGHRAADLSGGESQRVAIARAMANSPDVILADEPTGNLDSQSAGEILGLLEDLHQREGVALVMVTHDPGVSGRAGRVVRLFDGQVVSDGGRA
ncbi:MAG: ABC transporter ATP-binding protein [Acidobacteria bacterium]|nr:ABC transporter ATP-binding protein [Acidobacteriota bacterium]